MKRILIIGGYGTFGGRLAQLLAPDDRLTLIIAGRSQSKAEAFCKNLHGAAEIIPAAFDRDGFIHSQLEELKPDIIVDATGPFQDYGNDPYHVVKAALAVGIDYIDLADGSAFVGGIAAFDEEAKAKNLFVLSGASSFPVLTAAVVRRLAQGLASVETIKAGIAPSPYAGVGLNVIRAIASYAGKPVELTRGGHKTNAYALTECMRATIAPPGRLPLASAHFSLVDVPDLRVLPELWPGLQDIWMGAGPVPEILHRMLNALAWLVRFKIVPSLAPLAELFSFVINHVRWGEHRGGMFVAIEGAAHDGKKTARSWHLLAEGDDGPLIPSMAAAAIIGHCLAGNGPVAGARAAVGDLEIIDYDAMFATRTIYTGFRQAPPEDAPVYQRVLGDAWDAIPPVLRDMHDLKQNFRAEGRADIDRGRSPAAAFLCRFMGFPKAGRDIPLMVSFEARSAGEMWERDFGGEKFRSYHTAGSGRSEYLLNERFGLLTFGMALVTDGDRLRFVMRRWTVCGVPLPRFLMPGGDAYESADNGRFNFHVEVKLPIIGLIILYKGWLVPKGRE